MISSVAARILEHVFQDSLFGDTAIDVDTSFADLQRRPLDERCWVDFAASWLGGADDTFDALVESLDWHQRTVTMYDRRLPEPRLTSWWSGVGRRRAAPRARSRRAER